VAEPSTQRKPRIYIPNLAALCAFARDIVFPISSSIQNFKYLWLAFSVGGNVDPYVKDNHMSI
jgi:hypothetical protein